MLRHPNCGLGQVAKNYGRYLQVHPLPKEEDIQISLLVPKGWMGAFGDSIRYIEAKDRYRRMPWLIPHGKEFDLWHSIHQLSAFQPPRGIQHRILTIHDLNFIYEKSGRKQHRFLRRLQREADRSSTLTFISHFAFEEAQKHLRMENKWTGYNPVIYNGVEDTTQGSQLAVEGLDNRPFLLSIGVVKEKKNLRVLLPLMERMKDYSLVIAGDDRDPYAQRLKEEILQRRLDNIQIIGPISDAQRRWLYAHCEGLLFPSKCEGFGLPVIEMMQWGKPVFSSTETSLREIGGRYACFFDSYDPADMERTVRAGLAGISPELAAAEQAYAQSFSYERHFEAYICLWKAIRDQEKTRKL